VTLPVAWPHGLLHAGRSALRPQSRPQLLLRDEGRGWLACRGQRTIPRVVAGRTCRRDCAGSRCRSQPFASGCQGVVLEMPTTRSRRTPDCIGSGDLQAVSGAWTGRQTAHAAAVVCVCVCVCVCMCMCMCVILECGWEGKLETAASCGY